MPALTDTGIEIETFADVQAGLDEDFRGAFGQGVSTRPQEPLGQIRDIMAERFVDVGEALQAIVASLDPDQATGDRLDAICAITGTVRRGATYGTVGLRATGTAGTAIAAGKLVSDPLTSKQWTIPATQATTLTSPPAWASTTAYVAGDQVRTTGSRIYECLTGGTSSSTEPTSTAASFTDGSVLWAYLGTGNAVANLTAAATATGSASTAVARAITAIDTPVSGWQSVINLEAAEPGEDREPDALLRLRREAEVAGAARGTVDGIRAQLSKLSGVTSVQVYENATDATVDSMPPHSVEAVVLGGDEQEILDTLLACVAAGIATYGTTSGTATDSEGVEHTVKFTRPAEVDVYMDIEIETDDGYETDAAAISAIVDFFAGWPPGSDITAGLIREALDLPGVVDTPQVFLGSAPSPGTSARVVISNRQIAKATADNITLASSSAPL